MVYIRLKNIVDEVFQDYKKPSMMLATCKCNWKCLIENGLDISICQNSKLVKQKDFDIPIDKIVDRYIKNPITKAIIIGGLEPLLQFNEVMQFIQQFRQKCEDDIVIYTGYYPHEVRDEVAQLKHYKNIIIKFGRYKHNDIKKLDDILGVWLSSQNQFAIKIS